MRNPKFDGLHLMTGLSTNPGSPLARVFSPVFDGSTTVLKQTHVRNIQEEMDAYAPECDIAVMLNRLKVGDTSVLSDRTPLYGDASQLDTNPASVINNLHFVQATFDELPATERSKFNNDWRVYFASLFSTDSVSAEQADGASTDIDASVSDDVDSGNGGLNES